MFSWLFRRDEYLSRAERMRRTHSRWLSSALQSGRSYPRIPTRPVDDGGFSGLMSSPGGPEVVARWWDAALDQVEPESDD